VNAIEQNDYKFVTCDGVSMCMPVCAELKVREWTPTNYLINLLKAQHRWSLILS